AYLEDHAAFTRRGKAGIMQVDTDGLVAAGFVHRTSRAADPQLHCHVLVSNKVWARDDQRWLSLDGRELYASQKAAGMLYKAALRAELTRGLGVDWTEADANGIAEIRGVPRELTERWSRRREEVEAEGRRIVAQQEAALGRSLSSAERAQAYQRAAYRTRAPKVTGEESTESLRARWAAEARAWGQGPERWLDRVLDRTYTLSGPPDMERALEAARARLEESAATWGRAQAVEVLSTLVTGADAEDARRAIEAAATALLDHAQVVSLAGPFPADTPPSLGRADGAAAMARHG